MLGIFRIIIVSSLIIGTEQSKEQANNRRWTALAPFVKKHFDTGNKTLDDIAFELSYADYKNEKKKDDMWKRFSEEIG